MYFQLVFAFSLEKLSKELEVRAMLFEQKKEL